MPITEIAKSGANGEYWPHMAALLPSRLRLCPPRHLTSPPVQYSVGASSSAVVGAGHGSATRLPVQTTRRPPGRLRQRSEALLGAHSSHTLLRCPEVFPLRPAPGRFSYTPLNLLMQRHEHQILGRACSLVYPRLQVGPFRSFRLGFSGRYAGLANRKHGALTSIIGSLPTRPRRVRWLPCVLEVPALPRIH